MISQTVLLAGSGNFHLLPFGKAFLSFNTKIQLRTPSADDGFTLIVQISKCFHFKKRPTSLSSGLPKMDVALRDKGILTQISHGHFALKHNTFLVHNQTENADSHQQMVGVLHTHK